MKKTKPVEATTAVAMDSFDESKEKTLTPGKDKEGHYIGDDGDRLFTRDEVTQILRVRLDRQLKSITERYSISNLGELDALVELADKVNSSVESYRNSRAYTSRLQKAQDRENYELAMKLKDMVNWNNISIIRIQRFYGVGFPRANKIFQDLLEHKLIEKLGEGEKQIYLLNREEVSNFIKTFGGETNVL